MDIENLDKIEIRLADVARESVVDGSGIRYTLFVQGCPHHCEGCHNPTSHRFEGGHILTLGKIAGEIVRNPLLDGVTFSGGEPFCYPKECAALAKFVKSRGMNVWSYSGYTLDELREKAVTDEDTCEFLQNIDVLVDGRFVLAQKNLMLRFKGSENQRIINLKAMRESGSDEVIILF